MVGVGSRTRLPLRVWTGLLRAYLHTGVKVIRPRNDVAASSHTTFPRHCEPNGASYGMQYRGEAIQHMQAVCQIFYAGYRIASGIFAFLFGGPLPSQWRGCKRPHQSSARRGFYLASGLRPLSCHV